MDTTKFRELILYISQKCADDPTFGATKLDKILFQADMEHYLEHGRTITSMEYMKLPNGPVPRMFAPIRDDMMSHGEFAYVLGNVGTLTQERPVACRPFNRDVFGETELNEADRAIAELWGKTATEVSRDSHQLMGWKVARNYGDTIPDFAYLIDSDPLTSDDIEWGQRIADEYGLQA